MQHFRSLCAIGEICSILQEPNMPPARLYYDKKVTASGAIWTSSVCTKICALD